MADSVDLLASDVFTNPVSLLSFSPLCSPPPAHSNPMYTLPCWLPAHRQTAPYGLGNPPRRRRRSLPKRCECSSAGDSACATFCHRRPW